MEIANKKTERSTVITAVITLIIIGLSLLVSTWQTMSHQRSAEEEHLLLTSRAVLLAVESSLRRGFSRNDMARMPAQSAELFEQLEKDGDVLFAGIINNQGGRLLTSPLQNDSDIELPAAALTQLFDTGEWHGRLKLGKQTAYVYGRRITASRSGHQMMMDDAKSPAYLLVGIDIERHLKAYQGVKQNAWFQAIYIFAAALFMWGLAISFLSRREQANKAGRLERFQATLLDNLPDGLITLQAQKNDVIIQSANPAALRILGKEGKDVLGENIHSLPPPVTACLLNREQFSCPSCWQSVQVEATVLEVRTLPLALAGDNSFMMLLRDRTQLRQLEQSLAEAEKLAVIGSLAAGVAHEVRNPLSALRGFAQYFVKKLAGQQPEEEYAKTMVREADRLNRVITDLLYLAKPKALDKKSVSLPNLVEEVLALLRFDIEQKNITIIQNLHAKTIVADADALKQTLLNLLLNSIDAITAKPQEKPTITIASGIKHNANVWLEVQDTGCGMTQEQRKQAFEPFFTAKEHGTGLGLALVQRFMHEHKGKAKITSSEGNGCSITLEFTQTDNAKTTMPPHLGAAE